MLTTLLAVIGYFIILCLIAIILYVLMFSHKWKVRDDVPTEVLTLDDVDCDLSRFQSGDILLVFGQGHETIWATGHMAIVVRFETYGQLYVWDMPNPLFYVGATVYKPLRSYLRSALKKTASSLGQTPRVYVQHLRREEEEVRLSSHPDHPDNPLNQKNNSHTITTRLRRIIQNLATNGSFNLDMIRQHLKFCWHSTLLPILIPPTHPEERIEFLNGSSTACLDQESCPNIDNTSFTVVKVNPVEAKEKQHHTCATSVLGMLVAVGVLRATILQHVALYVEGEWLEGRGRGQNIYPHMFVHPKWNFSKYFMPGWTYDSPIEILVPSNHATKNKHKHTQDFTKAAKQKSTGTECHI